MHARKHIRMKSSPNTHPHTHTYTHTDTQVGEFMHLYVWAFIRPQRNAASSKLLPDRLRYVLLLSGNSNLTVIRAVWP